MQERRKQRFNPRVGKIPWRRTWHPTPVFLPGESHGQRSLVGYSPWGHKELDMTEHACAAAGMRGCASEADGTGFETLPTHTVHQQTSCLTALTLLFLIYNLPNSIYLTRLLGRFNDLESIKWYPWCLTHSRFSQCFLTSTTPGSFLYLESLLLESFPELCRRASGNPSMIVLHIAICSTYSLASLLKFINLHKVHKSYVYNLVDFNIIHILM